MTPQQNALKVSDKTPQNLRKPEIKNFLNLIRYLSEPMTNRLTGIKLKKTVSTTKRNGKRMSAMNACVQHYTKRLKKKKKALDNAK